MIDTNEMRNNLGEALVTPGLTVLSLLDEIDRLRKQAAVRECEDQRELAMEAVRQGTKQTPQGKTVRAEAFYAVDRSGYYRILGICGDSETQEFCRRDVCNDADFDDGPVAFGRITATLPVPEEVEVVAEVEDATQG